MTLNNIIYEKRVNWYSTADGWGAGLGAQNVEGKVDFLFIYNFY